MNSTFGCVILLSVGRDNSMKRGVHFAAVAVIACAMAGGVLAASPQQDLEGLDPTWAAKELERTFQSGDQGSTWAALKAVFPADYEQLIQDMARAIVQEQDPLEISQSFIQNHFAGQIQAAQSAPAQQQSYYQVQKADFLTYLSQVNVEACAYLGSGIGDPSSLETMPSDQMERYSDLMAVAIETIGAGLSSPVTYSGVTLEDVSEIQATMTSQGVSDEDAQLVLTGQVGSDPDELCRVGIIRNNALAAAPADVVAKMAFR